MYFIFQKLQIIPDIIILKALNEVIKLPKDITNNDFIEEQDIQECLDFNEMLRGFFDDMKLLSRPVRKNHTFWTNLKDFFTKAQKIDKSVYDFFSERILTIFDYAFKKNLKPDKVYWNVFGFYMWRILCYPEKAYDLPLPKEIIDFALEQFEGKRITVEKVNGVYTIVFLE